MKTAGFSLRSLAPFLVLVAAAVAAAPARAASTALMKIDAPPGESAADPAFQKWIEIESYDLGATQNSSMGSETSGAGAGRASLREITITKNADASLSPKLWKSMSSGKHFPKVTIEMRKAGGDPKPYLVYTLEQVFVSNMQTTGVRGDMLGVETIKLSFSRMEVQYTAQRTPTPGIRTAALAPGALQVAAGPPSITGATAAAPFMGLSVTVTITSTRACANAFVDYGDGSIAEGHALTSTSTRLAAHTYPTAGAKTIKVGGRDAPYWPPSPPKSPQPHPNDCTGWAPVVNVTLRSETVPAQVIRPH